MAVPVGFEFLAPTSLVSTSPRFRGFWKTEDPFSISTTLLVCCHAVVITPRSVGLDRTPRTRDTTTIQQICHQLMLATDRDKLSNRGCQTMTRMPPADAGCAE